MTQEMLAKKSQLNVTYMSQIERADLYKRITCTAMFSNSRSVKCASMRTFNTKALQKYLECLSGIISTMPPDIESKNQS